MVTKTSKTMIVSRKLRSRRDHALFGFYVGNSERSCSGSHIPATLYPQTGLLAHNRYTERKAFLYNFSITCGKFLEQVI